MTQLCALARPGVLYTEANHLTLRALLSYVIGGVWLLIMARLSIVFWRTHSRHIQSSMEGLWSKRLH